MIKLQAVSNECQTEAATGDFFQKSVFKILEKFTGKHLSLSFFFNKALGLRHRRLPVNFAKFLGTTSFKTPPGDCFLGK